MRKIIGIFIMALLILTALSSVSMNNKQINEEITDKLNSDKKFKTIDHIKKYLAKKFEY